MSEIKLKITTPERVIVNDCFNEILLPGESGDFQLLHNHENFASKLRVGVISVNSNGSLMPGFITSDAFATFNQDKNTCEVTTEYALTTSETKNLNKSDIMKEIKTSSFDAKKKLYQFILGTFE